MAGANLKNRIEFAMQSGSGVEVGRFADRKYSKTAIWHLFSMFRSNRLEAA